MLLCSILKKISSLNNRMGMRKFIAVAFAMAITLFGVVPAQASTQSTIVIIDSGFNLSQISSSVVQEVCITTTSGCNNGTDFEIGPGAAQTSIAISSRFVSDWNHGTNMALSAISANPNIKLIVIRNARVYPSGNVLFGSQGSLEAALQWVLDNRTTYKISGVLMSRGSHTHLINNTTVRGLIIQAQLLSRQLDKMGNAPIFSASIRKFTKMLNDTRASLANLADIPCPASTATANLVSQLQINNVASIFATGNDFNSRFVDSPACLDQAIAVTAADASGKVLQMANVAPNTDFAVVAPSTSVAAARFAGRWSLVYNGSYANTYASLLTNGTSSGSWSTTFIP